jgi:hypothetical protein
MDSWERERHEREPGLKFSEAIQEAHKAKKTTRLEFIFPESEVPEELASGEDGDHRGGDDAA